MNGFIRQDTSVKVGNVDFGPGLSYEATHTVVVDGITEMSGKTVVSIHDPAGWGSQYHLPLYDFQKALTGEGIFSSR